MPRPQMTGTKNKVCARAHVSALDTGHHASPRILLMRLSPTSKIVWPTRSGGAALRQPNVPYIRRPDPSSFPRVLHTRKVPKWHYRYKALAPLGRLPTLCGVGIGKGRSRLLVDASSEVSDFQFVDPLDST